MINYLIHPRINALEWLGCVFGAMAIGKGNYLLGASFIFAFVILAGYLEHRKEMKNE